MKQTAIVFMLLLAVALTGCMDKCFDDMPVYRSNDYGKTLSINITQNNNPVSFDSVTVVYPQLKKVLLNRTPLSLTDSLITLILRNPNTPADTLTIGYEVSSDYNFECEKAYVGTGNHFVRYSSFDTSYFISLNLAP
jgi:hypothetical protein